MDQNQLDAYLRRIGLDTRPLVSAEGLAQIQQAHLRTVPFENIDIIEGRVPLALDEASLFEKIVTHRRGGICYELNILFAAALEALGFQIELHGARHPKYGDDMDHLFVTVKLPDEEIQRIADVGFAYNFAKPLLLAEGVIQDDGRDRYLLEAAPDIEDGYMRLLRLPGLEGSVQGVELFAFGPEVCKAKDCRARCDWLCTSPDSRFTQGPLVCLDTPDGRRTLSANHLVTTIQGERISTELAPGQFETLLDEFFQ